MGHPASSSVCSSYTICLKVRGCGPVSLQPSHSAPRPAARLGIRVRGVEERGEVVELGVRRGPTRPAAGRRSGSSPRGAPGKARWSPRRNAARRICARLSISCRATDRRLDRRSRRDPRDCTLRTRRALSALPRATYSSTDASGTPRDSSAARTGPTSRQATRNSQRGPGWGLG
jgi:hypothetical protein